MKPAVKSAAAWLASKPDEQEKCSVVGDLKAKFNLSQFEALAALREAARLIKAGAR